MCNTFLPGMGCIFLHVSFFYVHVLHFFICISFYVYVFYMPLICMYYIPLSITVSTSLNMFIYNAYLSVHAVIYVYLSYECYVSLGVYTTVHVYLSYVYYCYMHSVYLFYGCLIATIYIIVVVCLCVYLIVICTWCVVKP